VFLIGLDLLFFSGSFIIRFCECYFARLTLFVDFVSPISFSD